MAKISPTFLRGALVLSPLVAIAGVLTAQAATAPSAPSPIPGAPVIELRGGEAVHLPGPGGRDIVLRFTRVIRDGECPDQSRCLPAKAPIVEVERVSPMRGPTYRLSPAPYLGAPFVAIDGRFVSFAGLVSTGDDKSISSYTLKLTIAP